MLGLPLDFAPGERYAYSNYGYCLLGRVIETITKQSYEDYVKQRVLAPLGIHSMRLGRSRLEDRFDREVRYYDPGTEPSVFAADRGQTVPLAYGAFNLEAMDAHGGWLASSIDLVRFGAAFDDPEKCPILKPQSIREMYERPAGESERDAQGNPKNHWYGLGWFVRQGGKGGETNWHTGSLPGTSTILMRRADGRDVAVLFNSRVSPTVDHLTRALEFRLNKVLDDIVDWPKDDLFPQLATQGIAKETK
jgi:N-acyl-D-amino-acid deacylase